MKQLFLITILFTALVIGCTASRKTIAAKTSLFRNRWTLSELNGKPATSTRSAYLQFVADGEKVTGFTGCNRLSGAVKIEGTMLSFGPIITTKMACADAHDEQPFLNMLRDVKTFQLDGTTLTFKDQNTVVAKFKNEPASN